MKFNFKYFIITLIIFFIEILIATKLKHLFFIRAYLGDVIVVALVYTFVLSFFEVKSKIPLLLGVFSFAVFIEVMQSFKAVDCLGFKPNSIPAIVLGNTFSWEDILCYAIGCLIVGIIDKNRKLKD